MSLALKKITLTATLFGLLFILAQPANAANRPQDFLSGSMATGILESRHNIGAYGVHYRANNSDSNGGTTEICVFCHTPHHSNPIAPLWNKGNQSEGTITGIRPTTYTAYGTTLAGTNIADDDLGAASFACLSCHDGVNTFDTIANAPGKGNDSYNNDVATDFNWTFTEDGNSVLDIMTSVRLNIGTALADDHPVSMPYTETVKASLRPSSTVISSISMTTTVLTTNAEGSSTTTTSNRWAVMGYVNTSATIGDLLRNGKLECVSCHDPHFKNLSWDEVASTWGGSDDSDGLFLRRIGGNSLSGVCRTCHNK